MSTGTEHPATATERSTPRGPAAFVAVRRLFATETSDYFLLLGTTIFLVLFGLVMVLSSSAVESLRESNDAYRAFMSQGLYAVLGIPLMLIVSRMPLRFWKRWAPWTIWIGIALQLLVFTELGFGYGGNRNWLDLGAFTMQPSELVKLALCLWVAFILVTRVKDPDDWRQLLLPIGPVALGAIGLVLLGNDLGTGVVMLAIVFGAYFFAGVKARFLIVPLVMIAFAAVAFAQLSSSRRERINVWLNGCSADDYLDLCWQVQHGTWALASGGVFGVGLGNSRTKWSWLPEAENDFIFAIIGEELGLVGSAVLLLLFVILAIAFVRIMRRQRDPFARIVTAGVMVWTIGQAFVNIAVVLGALPVLGVPLPLISAGGSALIATLLGIGVVLSFARTPRDEVETAQPRGSARGVAR